MSNTELLRSAICKAITSFGHEISTDKIKLYRNKADEKNLLSLVVDEIYENIAALSAQSAVQEPVGYIQRDHLQKARKEPHLCRVEPTQRCPDFDPIYTHPSSAAHVEEIVRLAVNDALDRAAFAADDVMDGWLEGEDAQDVTDAIRALKTPAPSKGEGS